ncbi:MAG: hypothetical protein ACRDJF_04970 [Actinomycetota bacterium]
MAMIDSFEIWGGPTPEEHEVLLKALQQMLQKEREARRPSAWKLVGRALGLRGGILDYRTRMARSAWPLSVRLPWMGQPYMGQEGRGDSR